MTDTTYLHPESIVTGGWLEAHLSAPKLRIYDCTTYLAYEEGSGRPYTVVSGRADYEAGHIPGATFLDLQADFSVQDSPFRFTLPSPEQAAAAFARHGVSDDARIILYSRKSLQWATRFWWMLRWLGFDNAAILDGGWDKWAAEGRPVSTEPVAYPAGELTIASRPALFTGKAEALAAIGDAGTCTLNALAPDLHSGANARYGRPGHIPGSVNVPAAGLLGPNLELPAPARAAEAFAAVGAMPDRRILTYCGGGIAATLDAFLLHQLGHENVTVYDNSMSEWAADPALPIETG